MSTSAIPVTVVVPVKNEAANLGGCLAKLEGIAHTLVVDSRSTDNTVTIAASAGAKVLQFDWQGGFPKKRNWVLKTYNFSTDWVLFLDADEHLTEAFKADMANAIGDPRFVGYWLNYNNYFMGRMLRHGVKQRKLALFKRDAGLYEFINDRRWTEFDMEVHEHPLLHGPVSEIRAPIEHLDYRGIDRFVERHNAYSTWEAHRWAEIKTSDPPASQNRTLRQIVKYRYIDRWWFAPIYFVFTYILKGGFCDGGSGLNYAMMKYFYFLQVRLKIIEFSTESDSNRQTDR